MPTCRHSFLSPLPLLGLARAFAANKSRVLAMERRTCSGAPVPYSAHAIARASQGPGLQLGPHTSVPGVLHCRQKRDPVTMSPRAPVLPPELLVLAARTMFGSETFAKGLLCQAICKVLIPPRLNGTLFPSLGSSQSGEEERRVPQSFKSEGRRREGKPPLLALALCWAPHSHSEPH